MSKQDETAEIKYRVFRVSDGKLAYLPVPGSNGLTREEAERLSNRLAIKTDIREVWRSDR